MSFFNSMKSRLAGLFRRRKLNSNLDEEMRVRIERQTQENITNGMSSEEARRAASKQFGKTNSAKEIRRDQREGFVSRQLSVVGRDVHFAVRQLLKNPAGPQTSIR